MQCPEQSSSLARRAADGSRRGMSPLRLCRQKGVFPRVKKCAESADLWMKFHFCSWLTTCVNFCNGQMSVLCFVYLLQFMSSNVSYLWVWSGQRWEIKLRFCKKDTFFCEITALDLSYEVMGKSTVEISQNFVAFSEYMNFTRFPSIQFTKVHRTKNW